MTYSLKEIKQTVDHIACTQQYGIATVMLQRGKVNALNEALVEELRYVLGELERDDTVSAVILTGRGKFFSFGFDIPEFRSYAKADFIRYLTKFTGLYTHLFTYPKPVVASLNGHTIAGGCMLALACDHRMMVGGKARIALNEISFGSSVFAGSVDMLTYLVGGRKAERILFSGTLYSAEEGGALGLVDEIAAEEKLREGAAEVALDFARRDRVAFASMKRLLRGPIADRMTQAEQASVVAFADAWYSPKVRAQLEQITIRS